MNRRDFFKGLSFWKTAKCEELPLEEVPEEKLSLEDEETLEEKSHHIPSFLYLLQPVKIIGMNYPDSEINGFKFSFGSGFSHNFLMSHTINMAPKKTPVSTGNPIMDMFNPKTPYYTLGVQYHHGDIASKTPHVDYSLVGRIDTTGRMEAIFAKNYKNIKVKMQASFLNNNVAYSQTQCEIEHASQNTKQTLTFSSGFGNYNFVEKLGNQWLVGFDLTYIAARRLLANGFALRFARKSTEKYYLQISEMSNSLTLGGLFKVNDFTSFATELELGGNAVSDACLGYRNKTKNYEVNSSIKTNGEIKSIFTWNQTNMYKLRLFLGGNLWKEDFKSGFAFTVGQSDD